MSIAVASRADIFGVIRHDELQDTNEAFVGSFSSGQIIKSWSLGHGRAVTQLGQISLSLGDDGSTIAVSVLPHENNLPKTFHNLRLYYAASGQILKCIRTKRLDWTGLASLWRPSPRVKNP